MWTWKIDFKVVVSPVLQDRNFWKSHPQCNRFKIDQDCSFNFKWTNPLLWGMESREEHLDKIKKPLVHISKLMTVTSNSSKT